MCGVCGGFEQNVFALLFDDVVNFLASLGCNCFDQSFVARLLCFNLLHFAPIESCF